MIYLLCNVYFKILVRNIDKNNVNATLRFHFLHTYKSLQMKLDFGPKSLTSVHISDPLSIAAGDH